jgi:hypothetical protein
MSGMDDDVIFQKSTRKRWRALNSEKQSVSLNSLTCVNCINRIALWKIMYRSSWYQGYLTFQLFQLFVKLIPNSYTWHEGNVNKTPRTTGEYVQKGSLWKFASLRGRTFDATNISCWIFFHPKIVKAICDKLSYFKLIKKKTVLF